MKITIPSGVNTEATDTKNLLNTYSAYLKKRFGVKVRKITVDGGFSCPNRDGTIGREGCIYCDNAAFSPAYRLRGNSITDQLNASIAPLRTRFPEQRFLAYFQPFTNTYAPVDHLERLYTEALGHPDVIGLVIGTRPDCIQDDVLHLLETLSRRAYVSVEYGCESVYDKTLQWIGRGHTFAQLAEAVKKTAACSIETGLHLILGFPTETRTETLAGAAILSELPIQRLKIHHLHILKNTPLAERYVREPFPLPTQEAYIEFVTDFVERLSPAIVIERLCGESPPEITLAPTWHLRGAEIFKLVREELRRRNTVQGFYYTPALPSNLNLSDRPLI